MNLEKALKVIEAKESWGEESRRFMAEVFTAFASPHDAIQEFHVGDVVKDKKGVCVKPGKVEGFDYRGWPKVQWCNSLCSVCPTPRNPANLELLPPATPPPVKFQVDDFVRVKENAGGVFKGKKGRVVYEDDGDEMVGIEFTAFLGTGDCNGLCAEGHGMYLRFWKLELTDRPGGE